MFWIHILIRIYPFVFRLHITLLLLQITLLVHPSVTVIHEAYPGDSDGPAGVDEDAGVPVHLPLRLLLLPPLPLQPLFLADFLDNIVIIFMFRCNKSL